MYKILRILILGIVLLKSIYGLSGQKTNQPSSISFDELGVKQGLSQGMINCIFQDKEGYIWIATKNGLNRYNSYSITTFRHDPNDPFSLPDNYCNSVAEDGKGNLWIGTNTKGLFVFNKKTEKFYNISLINIEQNNLFIKKLEQVNGKLYVETSKNVLMLSTDNLTFQEDHKDALGIKIDFDFSKYHLSKKYESISQIAPYPIWSVITSNSLWLSTQDSVYKFQPSGDVPKWNYEAFAPKSFGIMNNKTIINFFSIPDDSSQMILAYNNRISHLNTKTNKIIYTVSLPDKYEGQTIKYFKLNNGNIYCIIKSKVYIYNPVNRTLEVETVDHPSIFNCSIKSLFIDIHGIQWFGSTGCGIIKHDPQKKRFRIYSIYIKDLIHLLTPYKIKPISPQLYLPPSLNRISLGKDNKYWILKTTDESNCESFLNSFNIKTGKIEAYEKFLSHNIGYTIYNDDADRLWYCYQNKAKTNCIGRINKEDGTMAAVYEIPASISSNEQYVSQLFMDSQSILWLATINGLYSFDEKNLKWNHWKNIPNDKKSISANGVLSICPDPKSPEKYLWLGIEGAGFNRFEKSTGNCINYNETDGLPNNVAYCIQSDSLNNLWISTNRGLSCFDPLTKTFRNFTDEDGLPGNEFNRYSSMKLQNGELLFGGINGNVIFDPETILKKQSSAPIFFTSLSISNKPIKWHKDSKNLNTPIEYAKNIILQPGENIFSVSFAILEYRSNQKKLYKYKLEGFDKDWSSPSSKNEVYYTNLNPGHYILFVMGASTDGVWNEKLISLNVIVKPYWYQTYLFKIFIIAIILTLLYTFYQYRLRQRLQLEKLRNRIARDLHDEIGSTLSSISIYAAAAKKVTIGNEKAENILSKINDGTSEMMEAMNDIVWAVNSGSDHFYDLVNRIRSYAVQVTEAKKIGITITENKDIPDIQLGMEQRKNIYLICKEAISNAVKYSACGQLDVIISVTNNKLTIWIKDNGIGFESNQLGYSSGGNGLKNMRFRAEEIGSYLEINSVIDVGTKIILIVPVKKS